MCTAPRLRLRTRRVALIHAVQNFAQLDDIYGRARHPTIVMNANTHIVLLGTGQEEAVNCFIRAEKKH
ncbi:MAG: TraM recognition domain-containing protein [Ktedonobacteraceae bacterium]|nr:TraM recognition domain-containing protein [Ktedonobacteraceae bacterium]